MDLNDRLEHWKEALSIVPREEMICKTIQVSQDCYLQQTQDLLLRYWEFLWSQLHYTRKRWWAFQAGLLLLAWQSIPLMETIHNRVRGMGVIGCLFVVLMIPELWRNRENDATQVEAACLYSLRQIYAARITLFGMVDVALLSLFTLSLERMGFTVVEVVSQFLLPVTVTACICFSLLCGKRNWTEAGSLAACLIFGGGWWFLLMNEKLYVSIVPAVWVGVFFLALMFLVLAVRTAVRTTNQYWEVEFA